MGPPKFLVEWFEPLDRAENHAKLFEDAVFVSAKTLEAWFHAGGVAMASWLEEETFHETTRKIRPICRLGKPDKLRKIETQRAGDVGGCNVNTRHSPRMLGQLINGPNAMLHLIEHPARFPIPADQELTIEEYIGAVRTGTASMSIARLRSCGGWSEPPQQPEFDEYTLVLHGELHVENVDAETTTAVKANQAIIVPKGVKIRYSTPTPDGADYIAVCVPAFTMDTAHRDPI